jgi:hypothetical protein
MLAHISLQTVTEAFAHIATPVEVRSDVNNTWYITFADEETTKQVSKPSFPLHVNLETIMVFFFIFPIHFSAEFPELFRP